MSGTGDREGLRGQVEPWVNTMKYYALSHLIRYNSSNNRPNGSKWNILLIFGGVYVYRVCDGHWRNFNTTFGGTSIALSVFDECGFVTYLQSAVIHYTVRLKALFHQHRVPYLWSQYSAIRSVLYFQSRAYGSIILLRVHAFLQSRPLQNSTFYRVSIIIL